VSNKNKIDSIKTLLINAAYLCNELEQDNNSSNQSEATINKNESDYIFINTKGITSSVEVKSSTFENALAMLFEISLQYYVPEIAMQLEKQFPGLLKEYERQIKENNNPQVEKTTSKKKKKVNQLPEDGPVVSPLDWGSDFPSEEPSDPGIQQ
jgi:hypothetical protein